MLGIIPCSAENGNLNKSEYLSRCNPSVTGGYSLWTKVRRKGKGPPCLGVRSRHGGIGTLRRWFLRGRGGGQGLPRLLWRKLSPFTGAMGLPADASGAYRPNPQATTKLVPRPSSLKGYVQIEELRELGFKEGFCKSHLFRQSGAGAGIQNRLKILDSGSRRACPE